MDVKKPKQTQVDEEEKMYPPLSPISELLTTSILSLTIVVVFELETPIPDKDFNHFLCNKFLPSMFVSPQSSTLMKKAFFDWKKVDTKVEDHIIVPTFPPASKYEEHFQEYLSKISNEQFREGLPLWEVHVVKYPTRNGSMSLVFKLSHALGDGYSFMGLLFSTFQRVDDPYLPIGLPNLSLQRNGRRTFNLLGLFRKLVNTVQDVNTLIMNAMSISKEPQNVIRSMNPRVEFEPIVVASMTMSLDHIKQIKSRAEATVNDVVTGLIYYVIHLYKLKMGQDTQKQSMTAKIMFNTRVLKGYKSIDEMLKQNIWGNHVITLQIPIPSFTDKVEPLDFIKKAKANNQRMKNSLLPYMTYPLISLFKSMAGFKGAARFLRANLMNSSITITNVIGPTEKIAMERHPVNNFYFYVAGLPTSLVFTVVSYMGEVKLVATMEKKFIDSQVLLSCMNEAFAKMLGAISGQDMNGYKRKFFSSTFIIPCLCFRAISGQDMNGYK